MSLSVHRPQPNNTNPYNERRVEKIARAKNGANSEADKKTLVLLLKPGRSTLTRDGTKIVPERY